MEMLSTKIRRFVENGGDITLTEKEMNGIIELAELTSRIKTMEAFLSEPPREVLTVIEDTRSELKRLIKEMKLDDLFDLGVLFGL